MAVEESLACWEPEFHRTDDSVGLLPIVLHPHRGRLRKEHFLCHKGAPATTNSIHSAQVADTKEPTRDLHRYRAAAPGKRIPSLGNRAHLAMHTAGEILPRER